MRATTMPPEPVAILLEYCGPGIERGICLKRAELF
jgi:hypothetical protein